MAAVTLKDVELGSGRTKVIVPITGRTVGELIDQASALANHELDIVEWRVDHLDAVDRPDDVVSIGRQLVGLLGGRPVLFTFRTRAEGGQRPMGPAGYVALNTAVIEAGVVDAVDVEHAYDRAAGDAVIAAAHTHGVAVVGSFHDFGATPPADEIVATLVAMQERGVDIAKVAYMPQDAGDVLSLLQATWTMASEHPRTPVLTMSMAALGVVSRLSAPVFGSCATFAMVGRPSAPGQVPVEQLRPILALLDPTS